MKMLIMSLVLLLGAQRAMAQMMGFFPIAMVTEKYGSSKSAAFTRMQETPERGTVSCSGDASKWIA